MVGYPTRDDQCWTAGFAAGSIPICARLFEENPRGFMMQTAARERALFERFFVPGAAAAATLRGPDVLDERELFARFFVVGGAVSQPVAPVARPAAPVAPVVEIAKAAPQPIAVPVATPAAKPSVEVI